MLVLGPTKAVSCAKLCSAKPSGLTLWKGISTQEADFFPIRSIWDLNAKRKRHVDFMVILWWYQMMIKYNDFESSPGLQGWPKLEDAVIPPRYSTCRKNSCGRNQLQTFYGRFWLPHTFLGCIWTINMQCPSVHCWCSSSAPAFCFVPFQWPAQEPQTCLCSEDNTCHTAWVSCKSLKSKASCALDGTQLSGQREQ